MPRSSAVVPGVADAEEVLIHADHINMVKFASELDDGYKKISRHLHKMAASADDVIGSRWETESTLKAGTGS